MQPQSRDPLFFAAAYGPGSAAHHAASAACCAASGARWECAAEAQADAVTIQIDARAARSGRAERRQRLADRSGGGGAEIRRLASSARLAGPDFERTFHRRVRDAADCDISTRSQRSRAIPEYPASLKILLTAVRRAKENGPGSRVELRQFGTCW